MAKEIERRFLVKSLGMEIPVPEQKLQIEQGYFELISSTKSLRIRIVNNERGFLTSKTGKGASREEIEVTVLRYKSTVREIYAICDHKLEKERWVIDGWEVDIFKPPLQGIIIAERELGSENESLLLPSWLKDAIEVTDTLTNHQLARLASDLKNIDILTTPYLLEYIFKRIPKIKTLACQMIEQALKTKTSL